MDKNNDKTQIPEKKKIWHPQQQIILKKWGEIGSSYRYLHDKAFMYYSKQNFRFALPVIILSTITGTANFAQKSFPASTQDYVPLFIGFLNLTAGLITTVGQFLRVSELLEGHRSASLAYRLPPPLTVTLSRVRSPPEATWKMRKSAAPPLRVTVAPLPLMVNVPASRIEGNPLLPSVALLISVSV